MALSKEAAYSVAEKQFKQREKEKHVENFHRWIGKKPKEGIDEKVSDDVDDVDNGDGSGSCRSEAENEGTENHRL